MPPIELVLAVNYTPQLYDALPSSSWWWSEKLDGWRACWDGKQLYTRSGKALHPPKEWTAGLPGAALDGELYVGRGKYNELSGILRSHEGGSTRYAQWPEVSFCVFDMPRVRCGYPARYRKLAELVRRMRQQKPATPLRLVKQGAVALRTPDSIASRIIRKGGEGIVLRNVQDTKRAYVPGRSNFLLKLKERADAEARVLRVDREGPRLTALVVVAEGEEAAPEFRLGSGFTEAQRVSRSFVRVGDVVTYKYNGRTPKGVPRHASYLRHRSPLSP